MEKFRLRLKVPNDVLIDEVTQKHIRDLALRLDMSVVLLSDDVVVIDGAAEKFNLSSVKEFLEDRIVSKLQLEGYVAQDIPNAGYELFSFITSIEEGSLQEEME